MGPARVHIDLEEAILRGDIDLEEITGGVRVDAITGRVVDDQDTEPTVTEVRARETDRWMTRKGGGALKRKLDRRHRIKRREMAQQKSDSSSERDFRNMPPRSTRKDKERADKTLRWHSKTYKSIGQASLA